uniref:C2H2-type domain-containing protein n=1 Tax=Eptatretus burgeri TaxID=7764 RepID=A0A8C4R0R6_EPTBU
MGTQGNADLSATMVADGGNLVTDTTTPKSVCAETNSSFVFIKFAVPAMLPPKTPPPLAVTSKDAVVVEMLPPAMSADMTSVNMDVVASEADVSPLDVKIEPPDSEMISETMMTSVNTDSSEGAGSVGVYSGGFVGSVGTSGSTGFGACAEATEAVQPGSELSVEPFSTSMLLPSVIFQQDEALLSSKRLFQCSQCSYATSRRSHFHSHALHHHHQSSSAKLGSRHPTPSPHSCPLCPYQTAEAGLLSQHLSTVHSQSLPHLCQHCGKGFRHPSELRKHVRSHSGERPYACDLCTYRSAQAYNLQMHIRARHRHQPNFRCTVCGVAFSCLSELRRHVVLHGAEREYHCPHCTHRSSNSSDLKRHIVSIHTRNFPHRCQVCDKGFHRPSELTKHMGTHRGRRSHNCRHCDFHSTDPFALSRHVLSSHTHELPHQCRRCKKSFKLQTELKKHMKYHSGKKVYQCEFCDYHTMDASGYKRHVISMHTKDYPHRCPVCEKGFRRPSEQRQHLLRTHSLSSFP